MAIRELINYSMNLVGDGTATTIAVDLTNHLQDALVTPTVPNGVYAADVVCPDDATLAVASTSVLASVVTVTFNHAIPNGSTAALTLTVKF